jgi:hypothetical protein
VQTATAVTREIGVTRCRPLVPLSYGCHAKSSPWGGHRGADVNAKTIHNAYRIAYVQVIRRR